MDCHDEIEPGHDRRKPVDEHRQCRGNDISVCKQRRVRGVKGPAGVDATHDQRVEKHETRQIEYIPAREIDPRKRQIVGANRQRHNEIAKRGRDRGDQEEPYHNDAVHREHAVVDVRLQQPLGGREMQANQCRGNAANEKEECDRGEEQQRDPLVVLGQQPRADRVFGGYIAGREIGRDRRHCPASYLARDLM